MNTEAVRWLAAVIVNFLTPHTTIAAARSLKASHRRIHDVIVIENGSGDGSESPFQRELPGVRLVISQENRRFGGGGNLGIDEGLRRGAHAVLLLKSDATVRRTALAPSSASCSISPTAVCGSADSRTAHAGQIASRYSRLTGLRPRETSRLRAALQSSRLRSSFPGAASPARIPIS
jgi:GT2 family glycosyltransferase